MVEPHIVELPMWLQIVGAVACLRMLLWMADFSDQKIPGSGWVGHQGDSNG